jgi:hypothetical protein
MLVADPKDPRKGMANPVIWFPIELVVEVNVFSSILYE